MHNVKTQLRMLVLHPILHAIKKTRCPEAALKEAIDLCEALNYLVVDQLLVKLVQPHPNSFMGRGKLEEVAQILELQQIDILVINCALSPLQQRNLERRLERRILDRPALILEIFAAHAHSYEGRLQVELATLNYQRNRLQRSWEHLERQRGGFGFIGGPGERQIEIDRRLINNRITRLQKQLHDVTRTRELHRQARQRYPYPLVALVGYTNAGKSSLFNRLTQAEVKAENLLFTTLDPTMRVVRLPGGSPIILSDTVGFIADLPPSLIAAFRATLEEVCNADLLLHIRDIAQVESEQQKGDVEAILTSLGIDAMMPLIEVWNKCDLLPQWPAENGTLAISALKGKGLEALLAAIEERLAECKVQYRLLLNFDDGAALAWLYRHGQVHSRSDNDSGIELLVSLDSEQQAQFSHRFTVKSLSDQATGIAYF